MLKESMWRKFTFFFEKEEEESIDYFFFYFSLVKEN